MVAVLVLLAVFLSFFCSFVLNKQYAAILLVVIASSQMAPQAYILIYIIFFAAVLHFLNAFFKAKQNKSYLWILFLPMAYILAIFFIQPYKVNIQHYFGYLSALFIFAWATLIKWNSKEIVNFLSIYGSYLILAGFIEKAVTDNMRVGISLTVATAYAVVLVVTWTIWITICLLGKIYTKKIIAVGTFLVFIAIILSGARMGLLGISMGLVLCGLSFMLSKNKKINVTRIVSYSVVVIITVLLLSFMVWKTLPDDLYIKKSFASLLEGKIDESNAGRVVIWISAVNIIKDNKFLGIGAGNFHAKYKAFLKSTGLYYTSATLVTGQAHNVNSHAHNIYLMALAEHGVIGFIVLSIFIFSCLFQFFLYFLKTGLNPNFYALLSGFIVMAILGFVDSIPMYLPTAGFAAWFFGTCLSFKWKNDEYSISIA